MSYKLAIGLLLVWWQGISWASTIVVFGDSISAAYGLEVSSGWVAKLQHKLNQPRTADYKVVNASVSGETTTGGKARLGKILQQHRPTILVLELGGNDGLRGQPPALMQQNLHAMIQQAKQHKANVVLLGMKIPPNYGKAYNQAFEAVFVNVAKQERVPFVPFFLEGVGGNAQFMQQDGIHPNRQAQEKLLMNVWPTLQKLLP